MQNTFSDRMIKQLLSSVFSKYRDLSLSGRRFASVSPSASANNLTDLLVTDKSRYFSQPRPIIVNYYTLELL